MKTRKKIILIVTVLILGFIVIPSVISITSSLYCSSIYPEDCVTYSISLIPNFYFTFYDLPGISNAAKSFATIPTTCNDFMGKPDGKCFVKAFENCEYASIKNIHSTIEGDPIFSEAHIEIDGTCSITYSVDSRDDKWRDQNIDPISVKTCTGAQFSNDQIILECDGEQYGFSLK